MFEKSREEMVNGLKRRGYLESDEVTKAFLEVPRENFVPPKVRDDAYADRPLPIGRGQTVSAPSMIAIMLEALELEEGQRVLEIGTGSGYNAALMAELVGEGGTVYSIERLKSVADTGRKNLEETGYGWVNVIVGDGTKGYSDESPYDRILVTACSPEIPEPLVDQLSPGGVMAAPVGSHHMSQRLTLVRRIGEEETKVERRGGCAFVPLVGEYGWSEDEV